MRVSVLLYILPVVLAAQAPKKRAGPAPLLTPHADHDIIPDKYIVKFKDGVSLQTADQTVNALASNADYVYKHVLNGFSGKLDKDALKALRNHPDVEYIEKDAVVKLNYFVQQPGAPWGLGRISHRKRGNTSYVYDNSSGSGTCAYILDTGIDTTHPEFENRATAVKSYYPNQITDGNGHGTHVAGTVGSLTYGVAKRTSLYAIKVLDDSGSGNYSTVIDGMDLVVTDAKKHSCPKGTVVNMSLGGPFSQALNDAAAALVKSGIMLAVAAGNANIDANTTSPASEPSACTVGATTSDDARAYYSNYGPSVEIFAPGSGILSTWLNHGTNVISGTSMATPHITGLGAYFASLMNIPNTQALCQQIKGLATQSVLTGIPANTVNMLAFNGNPSG